ncbi:MAG: GTP 3',8-cyclase MoaA [Myxococcales bacterium]|nr:GTP 3',8-cyclase MoaA [Myxococcales bacterium]
MNLPVLTTRSAVYDTLPPTPKGFAREALPALVDARGRRYSYLRFSVTDRCDLACTYCMPPGGEHEHARRAELLSFEEIVGLARTFASIGIRRVRLTGGEPLVRKDICDLVRLMSRDTELDEIVMTTNATRLEELAEPLARAGLAGVNVSLDTLDPGRFASLTRGGELAGVLRGIRAAIDVGMKVKLNTVLLRGETDAEAAAIVEYAWALGATPRFIELMPIGEGANLPSRLRVTAAEVRALLSDHLGGAIPCAGRDQGPASYFGAADGSDRKVGFITPLSDEFCDTCNRVRVTARGDLRACLASRRAVSLRDVMRANGGPRDLAWAIHWSVSGKEAGHHFVQAGEREHENVGMSLIGG